MADVIGALVEALAADAGVHALAGDGVYGAELPPEAVARMPGNAIVVQPSGGATLTGGSDLAADAQRMDLIAYGATPFEANELVRIGGRCLRGIRRRVIGGTLIHWINSAGGFSLARDRDTDWPRAFQSFQVFHAFDEE